MRCVCPYGSKYPGLRGIDQRCVADSHGRDNFVATRDITDPFRGRRILPNIDLAH